MTQTEQGGFESRIGELWKGLAFFTVLYVILIGLTCAALLSGLIRISSSAGWPEAGSTFLRAFMLAALPATLALALRHLQRLFRSVLLALEELRTTV